jgi:hypothetical protein
MASPMMHAKTPERNRTPYQGLGGTLCSPLPFFSPSGANLFNSPLPLFHPSPFPKKNAAGSPLQQFSPGNINYESIFKSPLNTLGPLGTPGADQFTDQMVWKFDTPGSKNFMLPGDFLSPSPRAARAGERSSGKLKSSDGSGWGQPEQNGRTRGSQQLAAGGVYQLDNGDLLHSVLGSPGFKVRRRIQRMFKQPNPVLASCDRRWLYAQLFT